MRVVQRSVKSVLLRHSKSRTLVSVSKSPLSVPVTCRATSGAQSAWSEGVIVLHQTRTAPNTATKAARTPNGRRPTTSATIVARPNSRNNPATTALPVSGSGRRYQIASPAQAVATAMTSTRSRMDKITRKRFKFTTPRSMSRASYPLPVLDRAGSAGPCSTSRQDRGSPRLNSISATSRTVFIHR